jgi:multiple sugar transport system permease protein
MFRTIFALRAFGTIFTLTGGGPADRTAVIGIEVYRVGFSNFNIGLSATLSLLMLIVSLVIGIGYIRWLSREALT